LVREPPAATSSMPCASAGPAAVRDPTPSGTRWPGTVSTLRTCPVAGSKIAIVASGHNTTTASAATSGEEMFWAEQVYVQTVAPHGSQ